MSSDAHRLERLKQWLGEHEGQVSRFCQHYRLDRNRYSFINQVLNGHRNLGEKAARKLEEQCGRPSGWLDEGGEKPTGLRYDQARVSQLADGDRVLIEDFIEFVLKRSEKRTMSGESALSAEDSLNATPESRSRIQASSKRLPGKTSLNTHESTRPRKRNAA